MSSPSLFTVRRLLLSKQMFFQALRLRMDGSDISRMMACHHLDMAIELSLKTILTYLNPTSKVHNKLFPDLWKEADQACQTLKKSKLPYETDIKRVHDSRNKVQHDGSIPSTMDLIHFETSVKDFLDKLFTDVFSKNLEEIFLSDVIQDLQIKEFMKEAEYFLSTDEFDLSIEKVSIAFEYGKTTKLKEIQDQRGYSHILRSLYFLSSSDLYHRGSTSTIGMFTKINEIDSIGRDLEEVKKWIHKIVEEIEEMRKNMSTEFNLLKSINDILMLGLNYLEYNKFKNMSYSISTIGQDGNYNKFRDKDIISTKDDAHFCLNFVFNALLLWRS